MNDRPDEQAPPFDERAVLHELERLREQIERHKARRRAVEAEFEGFVRSFKAPGEGHAAQPAIHQEPARFTPVVESTALPPHAASASPARSAGRHRRAGTRAVIGGALVLLAGSALVTWTWTRRASPPSAAPERGALPPAATPAALEPPAAASALAPSADSELTTSRPVWVRVLADGQRVVERELPANARLPLKADKTIVIRTGDAGAIRLTIRGRDVGVLGRDGVVVTRTFSLPPRPRP